MRFRLHNFSGYSTRLFAGVVLSFIAFGSPAVTQAATVTWTGAGSDSNWSTGANWTPGVPPAGSDLVFPAASPKLSPVNNLTANTAMNSISISGSGYSISGAALTVNTITTSNATGTNDISLSINSATLTVTSGVAGSLLTFSTPGVITFTNNATFTGSGNTTSSSFINGGTSGTTSFFKDGTGTLTLQCPSTKTLSNNWLGATEIKNGVLQLGAADQIPDRSTLIIDATGRFEMQNLSDAIDALSGSGPVTRNSNIDQTKLFTFGTVNTNATYSGNIGGTCRLQKVGTGNQIFSGTSSFTGQAICEGGNLIITGSMLATFAAKAPGAVAGSGQIGAFINQGGTLSPGNVTTPGILTAQSINFAAAGTFHVRLRGAAPGTGYDQLVLTGAGDISGATLTADLLFTSHSGDAFTIISNTSGSPITGTFAGLAEGARFATPTGEFTITYAGGSSGRDVVLTNQSTLVQGVITDANGAGLAGVTVGDANHSVLTGADGSYAINEPDGAVTITPTLTGFQFNPASLNFTTTGTPITGANFSASAVVVNISGTITDANGKTVKGVSVTDGTRTALSGADGTYTISAVPFGTYTLTPSIVGGGVFEPGTRGVAITAPGDVTGQDFVLTITNANTVVNLGPNPSTPSDLDGDGFPNWVEAAAGTNPIDGNSTPFSGAPAGTPVPLSLSKLQVSLNFGRPGKDVVTITGTLPVPSGFVPTGHQVIIDLNQYVALFSLDKNGSSTPKGVQTFKLAKVKKGGTSAAFTAKLTGNIAPMLASLNLVGTADAKKVPVSVPVTLYFNNTTFTATKTLLYNGKKGKTFTAR